MFRPPNRFNQPDSSASFKSINAVRLLLSGCIRAIVLFGLLAVSLESGAQNEYLISPGDRISVHVYGEPELSLSDVPVPTDGTITYPFIGDVQAVNKNEHELAADITRRLKDGYLLQPQVTVVVSSYRPIYVGGEVAQPGQKSFHIGMDVEKVLALAGGATEEADTSDLVIQRVGIDGKKEFNADLSSPVSPGDVITVGRLVKAEEVIEYIFLYGEVKRPGRYEYSSGLSVVKAIIIAGGFSVRASRKKITITRGDPVEKIKRVPLESPVQPGDVITVGASLF